MIWGADFLNPQRGDGQSGQNISTRAAHIAKQQMALQPGNDKVAADWEALKKEVLEIRDLDEAFPLPWKSSAKKASSGKVMQDADLLTIQNLVKDEPKQLKEVAAKLGVHHFTLKKYLKVHPAFKIATKNNKAMLSYAASAKQANHPDMDNVSGGFYLFVTKNSKSFFTNGSSR